MPRKILHLDLDAFFCAVEENHDPSLRGKAFAIGGRPDQRGVVASCSYAARRFGVRSALPMSQAVRLCPDLIIRPARHGVYHDVSVQVMAQLDALTPDVEQISIDEAFLDVTLLRDDAESIARRLQTLINTEFNLPCSLGVATNKLVAKIANNIGKAKAGKDSPPNAILVVAPGEEAAFLAPLPVSELWGVGPKTAEQLQRIGIRTIGDLAQRGAADMERRFGKHGTDMLRHAQGIDERPVQRDDEAKSISKETTFVHDVSDAEQLKRVLRGLSDEVGRRLRREGLRGTTVKIKLRWADFTTLTRQVKLGQPTHHDNVIFETAWGLLLKTWTPGRPVRLIGVGVSDFETASIQQSLWGEEQNAEQDRLESALDYLHDRFGRGMVRRASDMLDEE
ncbi:MAG: DNA polymerase IV [Anaerolineae bacterium]|nr:DNA polymerase IV [Anaerolineae bacterium]